MLDIMITQRQGLKGCCPRNMFRMWVPCYVAQEIVVNIFLVKRWHWKKSFGVCLLKSAKCMAWIFQEGCMWEETCINESSPQFKK
jgi:hypothetical protein